MKYTRSSGNRVCAFVQKSVSFTRHHDLEDYTTDILWLQLSIKIFKICICYLFGSTSENNIQCLKRCLGRTVDHLNSEYTTSEEIILSDFNVNSEA